MALFVRAMTEALPSALDQMAADRDLHRHSLDGLGRCRAAIGQNNIKRLMAYSSIANMGYVLIGLATGTPDGVHGRAHLSTIYLVTNIGIFACILAMRRGEAMVENIPDLAGLHNRGPAMRSSSPC